MGLMGLRAVGSQLGGSWEGDRQKILEKKGVRKERAHSQEDIEKKERRREATRRMISNKSITPSSLR